LADNWGCGRYPSGESSQFADAATFPKIVYAAVFTQETRELIAKNGSVMGALGMFVHDLKVGVKTTPVWTSIRREI